MTRRAALPLLPTLAALAACAAPPAPTLVVSEAPPPRAESDEQPTLLLDVTTEDRTRRLDARAITTLADGRTAIVDAAGALRLLDGPPLLDAVIGAPAALYDGRLLAARATAPGESDLWLVSTDGAPPRALAAAPGADGQPFVMDDGRALFVSDRTGVASIFVVEVNGATGDAGLRQLTNRGQRPGRLDDGFVPPPVAWLQQVGGRVVYDAGDGTFILDVATGRAEVLR